MVNEFKLTVVHCTPKPDADLCMHVDLPLDKKLWKIKTGPPGGRAIAGRWPRVTGPSRAVGRWAFEPPGHRAAGSPGRRAAGPWRAVGRGPLGHRPAFSKTQPLSYKF